MTLSVEAYVDVLYAVAEGYRAARKSGGAKGVHVAALRSMWRASDPAQRGVFAAVVWRFHTPSIPEWERWERSYRLVNRERLRLARKGEGR